MEVYIILTDTGTLFTKLIKCFTKQPLNHASISFSRELDHTYSFGRKQPRNPFNGGFVRENLQGKLFQEATCAIYSLSVSEQEYNRMLQFARQVEAQQQSYKYNLLGLFGILLQKEWHRENAFFCSEFVANVLYHGGITINDKPLCFIKPSDLIEFKDLHLIYKGPLCYYFNRNNSSSIEKKNYLSVIPFLNRAKLF